MNNRPEYAEIDGKKYKINTDFRVALECDKISRDDNIAEFEKVLAIIYKLFGDDGLDSPEHYEKLLELGLKYLVCGKENDKSDNDEPSMDFEQDMDYIEASFISDHKIDIEEKEMHWWKFCNLLNGLTENCVLNRVRYIREEDISEIKDAKERAKKVKQKEAVALKKKEIKLSEKEQESINKFYELTGIKK